VISRKPSVPASLYVVGRFGIGWRGVLLPELKRFRALESVLPSHVSLVVLSLIAVAAAIASGKGPT